MASKTTDDEKAVRARRDTLSGGPRRYAQWGKMGRRRLALAGRRHQAVMRAATPAQISEEPIGMIKGMLNHTLNERDHDSQDQITDE